MKKLGIICCLICFILTGCCFKPNAEKIEIIKFSTWGTASEMAILKPMITQFEQENPTIKVQLMHIPQNYFPKLHLLFASKTEPDIFLINNLNLPVYSKFIYPLDDIIDKSIYFDKSLKSLSISGRILAIPRDSSILVVYYNKSRLKELGLTPPKKNWGIAELLNYSKALTTSSYFGISYEPDLYYALPYIHYFKGGILDKEYKPIINTISTKNGVQFYKDLAYKYHFAPLPSEIGSKTLAQMFIEGKICMYLSGRWLVPKFRECANFDWDIINFPNYSSSCDSTGWAISKRSKHKESSIKFLKYLSNEENIKKLTKSGLILPSRKDVAYSQTFLNGKPNNSHFFIDSLENSEITIVNSEYDKIVKKYNEKYFQSKE